MLQVCEVFSVPDVYDIIFPTKIENFMCVPLFFHWQHQFSSLFANRRSPRPIIPYLIICKVPQFKQVWSTWKGLYHVKGRIISGGVDFGHPTKRLIACVWQCSSFLTKSDGSSMSLGYFFLRVQVTMIIGKYLIAVGGLKTVVMKAVIFDAS